MAITKPPVLPAWADAGDKVQPSNAELSVGWPVSSTPPSRQRFNWALNFVANAVRYFSRRGLVDYDVAETYMIGDRVIGDDGKTYKCLVDNTIAFTPSTNPAKWARWGFTLAELNAEVTTPAQFDNSTKVATTAFVKRQGMAFSSQINIAATTTLTAASHVGCMILGTASSAITITLPVAGTVATGGCIGFQNTGYVATTISRQGTDTIYVAAGGNNTITVQPGEFVLLETDGYNWTASGTGVLYLAGSFGSSLSGSGYQKLPSGLIVQWGTSVTNASAGVDSTHTFPIAFPNNIFSYLAGSAVNVGTGGIASTPVVGLFGATLSSFIANNLSTTAGAINFTWMAIGN